MAQRSNFKKKKNDTPLTCLEGFVRNQFYGRILSDLIHFDYCRRNCLFLLLLSTCLIGAMRSFHSWLTYLILLPRRGAQCQLNCVNLFFLSKYVCTQTENPEILPSFLGGRQFGCSHLRFKSIWSRNLWNAHSCKQLATMRLSFLLTDITFVIVVAHLLRMQILITII